MRDSKGLRQLALLLREPGREFHVLDLLARIDPAEIDSRASPIDHEELAQLTVRSALGEDGGAPLDAQARAAYKQRLVELTDELEEAREFQDDERVARIEDILAAIEKAAAPAIVGGKPYEPDETQMDNVLTAIEKAKAQREKK